MKYNINNQNLSTVFYTIKSKLQENNELLQELYNIDSKYIKMKIDLQNLIEIVDNLKNEKLELDKQETILIHYNGNPYITLNLILLAILTKTKILLEFGNSYLGINKFIVKLTNNVLKEFQTENIAYLYDTTDKNIDKIICIDDINRYNTYLAKVNNKAKFYSFNYIDFYRDSDEFNELTELIYKHADENQIPIESYSELNLEDAASMMKNGLGKSVIILNNNDYTKQYFRDKIKNKKLYINKNPFEKTVTVINKEIFKQ